MTWEFRSALPHRERLPPGASKPPSEVLPLWKSAYDVYFSTEQDRANASFVEIEVERMELWIRGVTPEPFGLFPTILERAASSGWRLAPRRSSAAA